MDALSKQPQLSCIHESETMMIKFARIIVTACIMVSFVCLFPAVDALSAYSSTPPDNNAEERLVQYLGETLAPVSKAARVDYYHPHSCGQGAFVSFPRMELHEPLKNHVGVRGARDIFSAYHDLVVEKRGKKLVVVRVGTSPSAFLTTPIKSIEFSDFARYNAFVAIATILHTEAVQAAAARANLVLSPSVIEGLMNPPMPGLPYLPRKIQHVTLDDALNRVAITFGGVVVYSLCKDEDGSNRPQVYFDAFSKKK